jgi:hypothetical protein
MAELATAHCRLMRATGAIVREPLASHMSRRRHFGSVRKLPSGRYQASYWHEGQRHIAPDTYASKTDAQVWLSAKETDINRGRWVDPSARPAFLGRGALRQGLAVRVEPLCELVDALEVRCLAKAG